MAVFNDEDYDSYETIEGTVGDENDTLINGSGIHFNSNGTISTIAFGYYSALSGQLYEADNLLLSIEYVQFSDYVLKLNTGTSANESFIGGQDEHAAFNGGDGVDTLTYAGDFADYIISRDYAGNTPLIKIEAADGVTVAGEVAGFADRTHGVETLIFADGIYSLVPSDGNDILFGIDYPGGDGDFYPVILEGGAGDDLLIKSAYNQTDQNRATGGAGDDFIDGDFDKIIFSGDIANYTLLDNGDDTRSVIDNFGADGTDTIVNFTPYLGPFELIFTSFVFADGSITSADSRWLNNTGTFTDGGDYFVRTVLGSTETYYAGGGDDYVDGADTPSSPSIVFGEDGNDTLFGTQVTGGEGDDILTVTQNFSVVDRFAHGGAGDDIISSPREIRYDGNFSNFEFFDNQDGTRYIDDTTGAEGLDTILDIGPNTRFVFADQTLTVDDIEWGIANNAPVLTLADAVDGVITGGPGVNRLNMINYSGTESFDYTEVIPNEAGGLTILFRGFLTNFTRDFIFDSHHVTGVELFATSADVESPLVILNGSASDDILVGDRSDPDFVNYGSDGSRWVYGLEGDDTIIYDENSNLSDYEITPVSWRGLTGLRVSNPALDVSDTLFSVENVQIGGQAISFEPSEGVDYLFNVSGEVYALGGDDFITMTLGTLYAGAGNDSVTAGGGVGAVYAGEGNDYVTFSAYGSSNINRGALVVYGEDGDDILSARSVDGGAGNDILSSLGYSSNQRSTFYAFGGEGDDEISAYNEIRYVGEIANYTLTINDDGTRTISDNVGNEGTDTIVYPLPSGSYSGQEFVFSDITIDRDHPAWFSGDDIVYGTSGHDTIFTGAGNDTIYAGDSAYSFIDLLFIDVVDAGAGDDIIFGEAGRDTLTGGPGSDTIDGGTGDDTINADAEDIFTNLTGGEGNDRLNLTDDDYVNGSLDFDAQGFESARVFGTSGTEYASYVLGSTTRNFTINDVDNTETWSRQVLLLEKPGENNFTWVSRETVYDDNNEVQLITTVFDTGRENTVEYFASGEFAYSSITYDPADTAAWSRVETHYGISADSGATLRKRFVVEFDDSYTSVEDFVIDGPDAGASTRTLTDTADNQSWESWTFEFNAARQTVESARLNDTGILNTVTYDRAGEFDWKSRAVNTDVSAGVNYTSTTRELNAAGETMLFSIDYDTGYTVTTEYDLADSDPWTRTVTHTDADNTEGWVDKVRYYDEADAVYQTFWYADAGDDTVTFAGNTASDRHIATLESFVYLDYATNGFETGRVFNAAGEQLGSYYTASSGIGVYDNRDVGPDLLRTVRQLDLQDDFDWTSRDITYDLNNQIVARVDDYDDGRLVTTSYDLEGTTPYSEISRTDDRNDIFAWDAFEVYYDQSGDIFQQFYYVTAAEADTVFGVSANDRLVIASETFVEIDYASQGFETGRIVNTAGDLMGSYYVNSQGLGISQNNDVGPDLSRIVTQIDLQSDHDWVTREFTYDLSNAISMSVTDFDIGFTKITEWDLENEEIWARRETDVDADNTESWSYVEYYYDENDVLYDTIYYADAAA